MHIEHMHKHTRFTDDDACSRLRNYGGASPLLRASPLCGNGGELDSHTSIHTHTDYTLYRAYNASLLLCCSGSAATEGTNVCQPGSVQSTQGGGQCELLLLGVGFVSRSISIYGARDEANHTCAILNKYIDPQKLRNTHNEPERERVQHVSQTEHFPFVELHTCRASCHYAPQRLRMHILVTGKYVNA